MGQLDKKIINRLKKKWHPETLQCWIQCQEEDLLSPNKRPLIKINPKTLVIERYVL